MSQISRPERRGRSSRSSKVVKKEGVPMNDINKNDKKKPLPIKRCYSVDVRESDSPLVSQAKKISLKKFPSEMALGISPVSKQRRHRNPFKGFQLPEKTIKQLRKIEALNSSRINELRNIFLSQPEDINKGVEKKIQASFERRPMRHENTVFQLDNLQLRRSFCPDWLTESKWGLILAPTVILVIVFMLWMFLGALFYHSINGWSYTVSYYYAVQAGLSVGFGAIVEENDISRGFTIIHVLIGSSFVIYFLSVIIDSAVEEQKSLVMQLREQGFKIADGPAIQKKSLESKNFPVSQGDFKHDRKESMKTAIETKNIRSQKYTKEAKKREKEKGCKCDIRTFCEGSVKAVPLLIIVITLGVLFGIFEEGYSFVQALYFSVTALSTGGLQAPDVDPYEEKATTFLLGVWLVLGIPLFGFVLFEIAKGIVTLVAERRIWLELRENATKEEFYAAAQLAKSFNKRDNKGLTDLLPTNEELFKITDKALVRKLKLLRKRLLYQENEVDWAAFLVMTLLRINAVDGKLVKDIRCLFEDIDWDGVGRIDRFEMWASIKFDMFDKDHDGMLGINDFAALANSMGLFKNANELRLKSILKCAFNHVNQSATGQITRREFVHWIRTRLRNMAIQRKWEAVGGKFGRETVNEAKKNFERRGDPTKMSAMRDVPMYTSIVDALLTVGCIYDAAKKGGADFLVPAEHEDIHDTKMNKKKIEEAEESCDLKMMFKVIRQQSLESKDKRGSVAKELTKEALAPIPGAPPDAVIDMLQMPTPHRIVTPRPDKTKNQNVTSIGDTKVSSDMVDVKLIVNNSMVTDETGKSTGDSRLIEKIATDTSDVVAKSSKNPVSAADDQLFEGSETNRSEHK